MSTRFAQVLITALLLLCSGGVLADGAGEPPTEGSWAPAFRLDPYNILPDFSEGGPLGLDAFVGVRPQYPSELVLVTFASTGQVSTIEGLAALRRLQRRLGPRGLQVLVIASDADTVSMAEAISRYRVNFPVLRDRFGVVARRWGIETPPGTFLIDRQGRIRGVSDQPVGESEAAIREAVLRLLAQPSPLPSGP